VLPTEHCVGEPPRDPAAPTPWQQALTEALTAEVFAVRVDPGRASTRYLFSNLLYQSNHFKHCVVEHFPDLLVPNRVQGVGACEPGAPLTRQVVLWMSQYMAPVE